MAAQDGDGDVLTRQLQDQTIDILHHAGPEPVPVPARSEGLVAVANEVQQGAGISGVQITDNDNLSRL